MIWRNYVTVTLCIFEVPTADYILVGGGISELISPRLDQPVSCPVTTCPVRDLTSPRESAYPRDVQFPVYTRAALGIFVQGSKNSAGLGGRGTPTTLNKSSDLHDYHKCRRSPLEVRTPGPPPASVPGSARELTVCELVRIATALLHVLMLANVCLVQWCPGLWSRSRRLGFETVSRRINVSSRSRPLTSRARDLFSTKFCRSQY